MRDMTLSLPPGAPRSDHVELGPDTTVGGMLLHAARSRSGTALRQERAGTRLEISYPELGRRATDIARGLVALGVERGDRVAVLSDTRAEWTLFDCGALLAGAAVVPIYQTSSPQECAYVLAHSGARLIACEDQEQLAKVEAVRNRCPDLRDVVLMDGTAAGAIGLDGLCERGRDTGPSAPEELQRGTSAEDVATIVYTSGTTGPPKGCMLTHANVLAAVRMYEAAVEVPGERFVVFMFLPLAHVLARVTQMVVLDLGGTIAYWRGDRTRVLDDMAESRPTHIPVVPRILEKVHARAIATANERGPLQRTALRTALRVGASVRRRERAGETVGPMLHGAHVVADRAVLAKVRALFGGSAHQVLTGAAPIGAEVPEFFDSCGLPVLEGYGMTETCAAATLNTPTEFRPGTVGRPLPGMEIAVAGDGEVLMRGPCVFRGYYRDEAATAAAFDEDWLRSGDLGEIDDEGYLRITGRKKELIITSSGKNVAPSPMESALRESRWISEAVLYGDNRPYLVALLVLDSDELPALADHTGAAPDMRSMARDERVRREVAAVVKDVNQRFARIEQVKRFAILDHDLTQQADELTPTMKVKRGVVYERYRELFDALYE
jgi:long-chain acyl-CoA synthetase